MIITMATAHAKDVTSITKFLIFTGARITVKALNPRAIRITQIAFLVSYGIASICCYIFFIHISFLDKKDRGEAKMAGVNKIADLKSRTPCLTPLRDVKDESR